MFFEYNMSATMAKEILKARKEAERKIDPQTYLVNWVNEQMGLLHEVIKVSTTL